MPDAQLQQVPTIVWLLHSGGVLPLAVGLTLAVIAVFFVIKPSRAASNALAFLSIFPAIISLVVVYSAAVDFADLAASPQARKPAEFAMITGRAMGSSFSGLVATILSMFTASLAVARSPRCVDTAGRTNV
jgi:hypothetical protein